MQAIVYIDGYNFYFGLLKNTAHKWLDVVALVKHLFHIQNPEIEIVGVNFFTAPIITRVSSKGNQAQHAQQNYHRALKPRYPDSLQIING